MHTSLQLMLPTDHSPRLARQFAAGHLIRIAPGQYVDAQHWTAAPRHVRADVLARAWALRTKEPLCCETALLLHGVPLFGTADRLTALSRSGNQGRQGMVPISASAQIPVGWVPELIRHRHSAPTVATQDGHVTVHPAYAAAQILAHGSLPEAITVADAAAKAESAPTHVGHADENEWLRRDMVRGAIAELSYGAWRRRATARLAAGSALAESVAESGSRAVMLGAGLEAPVLQHSVHDHHGFVARVDFWWPRLELVGEVDGMLKYAGKQAGARLDTRDAVRAEKHRENRILATGVQLRRWGWNSITAPEQLIRTLTGAGVPSSPGDRLL
ncbi:hypothetical protein [Galactobacter caseinivorans]|uniref:Type IV toxin-antitoxin system AbiEi family antitoxin domain-containing protein n=1 Tax=Galactobacter caseinivorans TaxID=2676123 RepID=A0A496PHT7_9MICC|nr:hypothetical protein [Galactobacter caseinivorans]RKW70051.1 hypothetical protein DWQ67_08770 [Galactobacter caseinivorans]